MKEKLIVLTCIFLGLAATASAANQFTAQYEAKNLSTEWNESHVHFYNEDIDQWIPLMDLTDRGINADLDHATEGEMLREVPWEVLY